MYFKYDKILNDDTVREGIIRFANVPENEKEKYLKQLASNLRQQLFYAGLDIVSAYRLISFMKHLLRRSVMASLSKDDEGFEESGESEVKIVKCSRSEAKDLINALSKFKNKEEDEEGPSKKETEIH
jgi:hypothetical protein